MASNLDSNSPQQHPDSGAVPAPLDTPLQSPLRQTEAGLIFQVQVKPPLSSLPSTSEELKIYTEQEIQLLVERLAEPAESPSEKKSKSPLNLELPPTLSQRKDLLLLTQMRLQSRWLHWTNELHLSPEEQSLLIPTFNAFWKNLVDSILGSDQAKFPQTDSAILDFHAIVKSALPLDLLSQPSANFEKNQKSLSLILQDVLISWWIRRGTSSSLHFDLVEMKWISARPSESHLASQMHALTRYSFHSLSARIEFSEKKYRLQEQLKLLIRSSESTFNFLDSDSVQKSFLTLYKTESRNLVDLLSIADKKAGLLITTNAIVLSLVVSRWIQNHPSVEQLSPSVLILFATALVTIVLASLATRPGPSFRLGSGPRVGTPFFYKRASLIQTAELMQETDQMLTTSGEFEKKLIEQIQFYSQRLNNKFKLLRMAHTLLILGVLLSGLSFLLSKIPT